MKTLIVIQARMGSTRLPGKVLRPLAGRPLLERMIERVDAAWAPFEVMVATTTAPEDDRIHLLCAELGVDCLRGHPTDLLDRHHQAAVRTGADVVVKIPSDCPLIDPQVIERVLGAFLAQPGRWDYLSNLHPASYPDGNDVEVMTASALADAWAHATREHEREHTTPFLWDQPERFRVGNILWERGLDLSRSHRLTVDYPEDYALVAAIYEELWRPDRCFGLDEILPLLEQRPDLSAMNARHAGVNWYWACLSELRTITPAQTRHPEPLP